MMMIVTAQLILPINRMGFYVYKNLKVLNRDPQSIRTNKEKHLKEERENSL